MSLNRGVRGMGNPMRLTQNFEGHDVREAVEQQNPSLASMSTNPHQLISKTSNGQTYSAFGNSHGNTLMNTLGTQNHRQLATTESHLINGNPLQSMMGNPQSQHVQNGLSQMGRHGTNGISPDNVNFSLQCQQAEGRNHHMNGKEEKDESSHRRNGQKRQRMSRNKHDGSPKNSEHGGDESDPFYNPSVHNRQMRKMHNQIKKYHNQAMNFEIQNNKPHNFATGGNVDMYGASNPSHANFNNSPLQPNMLHTAPNIHANPNNNPTHPLNGNSNMPNHLNSSLNGINPMNASSGLNSMNGNNPLNGNNGTNPLNGANGANPMNGNNGMNPLNGTNGNILNKYGNQFPEMMGAPPGMSSQMNGGVAHLEGMLDSSRGMGNNGNGMGNNGNGMGNNGNGTGNNGIGNNGNGIGNNGNGMGLDNKGSNMLTNANNLSFTNPSGAKSVLNSTEDCCCQVM